jgi:indole-3-acetate monooxygenase
MNDMSAPKRAQQPRDLNKATYSTIFARTATIFHSAERILADVAELASTIAARAAQIEAERRVPRDLIEVLRSIGVFRMFAPQSHGGLELDLPSGLAVITALAKIEGSIGWTAMIGSGGGLFAPLLPRETYDRIYRDGPDVIIAGSIQPVGTAERAAGGWRVNGRWPFASGCMHADWLVGFCVMTEAGKPMSSAGGVPVIRGFFMPAHDWQIEDTWYAAGLKGTGSHHVTMPNKVVPEVNFLDFEGGVPCLPRPLYQAVPQFLPLLHGANSLGIAEGALDELVAHANTGRQQLKAATPMRQSEVFQFELGRIAAELRAARAYHDMQVASHWHHALAGMPKDEAFHAQGTQAGIWIATTCVRVADACFTLAGGSAVYESSPLQRRMRDLHAAAQHAVVHQRHYVNAGKSLLKKQPT